MTQPREHDQRRAYACALVAVLLWSTVASAFKVSLRYLDFAELLAYSSLVSTVLLAGIALATGRLPEVIGSTRRQWAQSWLLGLATRARWSGWAGTLRSVIASRRRTCETDIHKPTTTPSPPPPPRDSVIP